MSEDTKWEYKLAGPVPGRPGEGWAELELNPSGAEGWEAVAAVAVENGPWILMKRPKARERRPTPEGQVKTNIDTLLNTSIG
jgi:hypothetical protein